PRRGAQGQDDQVSDRHLVDEPVDLTRLGGEARGALLARRVLDEPPEGLSRRIRGDRAELAPTDDAHPLVEGELFVAASLTRPDEPDPRAGGDAAWLGLRSATDDVESQ